MEKTESIYVAGHTGMVGQALCRRLEAKGYSRLITPTRSDLDLLDQAATARFFEENRPDYVFLAAGKTGGIYANKTYRADLLYENLTMQCNVIHQAFLHEIRKLVFYACSCIYPRDCPQPMKEEHILSGHLEPTNEPFAVAKLAGLKLCESYNRQYGTDFLTLVPTNLYGPSQRYELMNSLVVPSLIEKFHEARLTQAQTVTVWGSGQPARDFLFVDDLADASIHLMENCEGNLLVNVGTGREYTIAEVAQIIGREVGYQGEILFDRSLPDGVHHKLQDITMLTSLGWKYQVNLEEGIRLSYQDYLAHRAPGR